MDDQKLQTFTDARSKNTLRASGCKLLNRRIGNYSY